MRNPPMTVFVTAALASLYGAHALAKPPAGKLTTLYQFPGGGDGTDPWGGLTNVNGILFGTTLSGGAYGRGAVFSFDPSTGTETVVYSFQGGSDVTQPQTGLQLINGTLYGVASFGGTASDGGIYTINPQTGAEAVVLNFTTLVGGGSGSSLVQSGTNLYGTTYGGNTGYGYGVVFKFDTKTNKETTLYSFTGGTDGGSPQSGVVYLKGMLYGGTTAGGSGHAGTLFAVNASTGAESTLYSFDYGANGGQVTGGVIYAGGVLYGASTYGGANGNGVLFGYTLSSGSMSTIYSFTGGQDGGTPQGPVAYEKGMLYGPAYSGGGEGFGTIYGVNATTGAETTLYTFTGGTNGGHPLGPVIDVGGKLYGTSTGPEQAGLNSGTVFRIDLQSGTGTTLHDFDGRSFYNPPNSALINVASLLYGTTGEGGTNAIGSVYSVDSATGVQNTAYSFTGGADGGAPLGGVIAYQGTLYGLAQIGGSQGGGVLYAVNPSTNAETVLYNFPAGAQPRGALLANKGVLFGVTAGGGVNGVGEVFGYKLATKQITTIHSFATTNDGTYPESGLTLNNGTLYGSTYNGGSFGNGTLYQINLASGTETVLLSFPGGVGGTLASGTPVYIKGSLYGLTYYGGNNSAACYSGFGCGVLYQVNTTTGMETVLHSFDYTDDGAVPGSTLLDVKGVLYGGTAVGGPGFAGTLFSYTLGTATFSTVYGFTGQADGGDPAGLLHLGSDFYGATANGATTNQGTVFMFQP